MRLAPFAGAGHNIPPERAGTILLPILGQTDGLISDGDEVVEVLHQRVVEIS
jgi:hypothetical protein